MPNDIDEIRKKVKNAPQQRIWPATKQIDAVAYMLHNLADSFHDVGNSKVADRLSAWATELLEAAKDIRHAVAEQSHADYQDSQASMGRVLTALISSVNKEKAANE